MAEFGSACSAIEPRMLVRLTMRPDADFFSSGRKAWVTATSPNRLVSNTRRKVSTVVVSTPLSAA